MLIPCTDCCVNCPHLALCLVRARAAFRGAATANLLFLAAVSCLLVLDLRALPFRCRHSFCRHLEIFLPSSYAVQASFLQPSNSPLQSGGSVRPRLIQQVSARATAPLPPS